MSGVHDVMRSFEIFKVFGVAGEVAAVISGDVVSVIIAACSG
tara:strand:- start:173 stop:298 length:126 start_codon:yes stop_codon:yes gene_type:complete